ncbi:MAG: nucleotidyltransferase substrate binding protein [Chitinophagaceae bacterium]
MENQDIRWQQRFANYQKALAKLNEAVVNIKQRFGINDVQAISSDSFLDDIIKEGIIQRFEYTHELAWKVMKDFLNEAGNNNIFGSKDATREAFTSGLITDGTCWMDMIQSRNKSSHTYNEETADEIFIKIMFDYHPRFLEFEQGMLARLNY